MRFSSVDRFTQRKDNEVFENVWLLLLLKIQKNATICCQYSVSIQSEHIRLPFFYVACKWQQISQQKSPTDKIFEFVRTKCARFPVRKHSNCVHYCWTICNSLCHQSSVALAGFAVCSLALEKHLFWKHLDLLSKNE